MKGFSDEVKDELAARDETTCLEELIGLAIGLDDCLRERQREQVGREPRSLFLPQENNPWLATNLLWIPPATVQLFPLHLRPLTRRSPCR